MGLDLAQSGATVTGTADFIGVGGQRRGRSRARSSIPTLNITITLPGIAGRQLQGHDVVVAGEDLRPAQRVRASVNLELDVKLNK